jgi:exodeoxyribonuclease-1
MLAAMSAPTFLWHDYETFGTNPRRDWPAQFAAIRTDADLNEVGAPMMWYCQPPQDRLPEPEACLITGITPQECAAKGCPSTNLPTASTPRWPRQAPSAWATTRSASTTR